MGGPSPGPFPSAGRGRGRGAPVSGRGAPAAPTPVARQPTRLAPQIGDFMAGMPVCRTQAGMVKPPARDINKRPHVPSEATF
jgi:hypothetical protein